MRPICPEHGSRSCLPWLPRFCTDHGHNPYPPPPPDVVGLSNWAAPEPMDIEPASPTTIVLHHGGLEEGTEPLSTNNGGMPLSPNTLSLECM